MMKTGKDYDSASGNLYTGFADIAEFRRTSLSYPVLKAACVLKQATDIKLSAVVEFLAAMGQEYQTPALSPSENAMKSLSSK